MAKADKPSKPAQRETGRKHGFKNSTRRKDAGGFAFARPRSAQHCFSRRRFRTPRTPRSSRRCLRDWPDDPQFIPGWNSLLKQNPWATVFRSPAWQSAVVNEFVPAGLFRLITVSRNDELLAVLPLALNTASMLETPGRWVTDYLDSLVDAQSAEACWEIILGLLGNLWDWSVGAVVFHHVRADSNMRQILPVLGPKFGFQYQESLTTSALIWSYPKPGTNILPPSIPTSARR